MPHAPDAAGFSFHPAPWSRSLRGLSVLSGGVCLGVAALLISRELPAARVIASGLVLLMAGALCFVVRGYEVKREAILVRRLFWSTRIPLESIEEVRVDPAAMRDSWRVFGNGGMFSFTGRYYSGRLGSFRALVTDPARAVVLRTRAGTIVVSPQEPDRFVREVEAAPGR